MEDIIKNLSAGKLIAIKTDTVYGLICNANNEKAVEKIYKLKNREAKKPISIFIKNKDELNKYVDMSKIDDKKKEIIDRYWPGALTIIFKKKNGLYDYLTCGNDTLGIRIPNEKKIIDILEKIDFPLAETSCNISGEPPYMDVTMIKEKFKNKIDMILDGGKVYNNVASTVVSFVDENIKILRMGDIKISEE